MENMGDLASSASAAAAGASMQPGALANVPAPNIMSNPERYLPLSMVLEHAIQKAYHDLTIMIDMYEA